MLKVDGYAFEVLQTGDNTIKTVRVQAVADTHEALNRRAAKKRSIAGRLKRSLNRRAAS